MTREATSTLSTDGTSTAALAQPSGFGDNFGDNFGGYALTWDAAVMAEDFATAVLTTDGTSTALLAP